jgi:hypothetical protein
VDDVAQTKVVAEAVTITPGERGGERSQEVTTPWRDGASDGYQRGREPCNPTVGALQGVAAGRPRGVTRRPRPWADNEGLRVSSTGVEHPPADLVNGRDATSEDPNWSQEDCSTETLEDEVKHVDSDNGMSPSRQPIQVHKTSP